MKLHVFVFLGAALALPALSRAAPAPLVAPPVEPVPRVAPAETASYAVSLQDLGFRQGHVFQGERAPHSQVFYFPLPLDGAAERGVVRLRYRASDLARPLSSLRIDLNDRPGQVLKIGDNVAPEWIELPLTREDLQKPLVKVTVAATVVSSANRCLDMRALALNFVHVLPESNVAIYKAAGSHGSLAAAWSSLPAVVRVTMPPAGDEALLATVLETVVMLQQMQRKVEIVRYPEIGHVAIASAAELQKWFGLAADAVPGQGQLKIVTRDAERPPVIVLSTAVTPTLLAEAPHRWRALLKGSNYGFPTVAKAADDGKMATLDLGKVGFAETKYVGDSVEWSLLAGAPLMAPGMQMAALHLNVVAAPDPTGPEMLMQVFINGALQEVRRLDNDGKPHSMHFSLGQAAQRASANYLRVVVQRSLLEGDCSGALTTYPVQFLPGSRLELVNNGAAPVEFSDLPGYFAPAPYLYLAKSAANGFERTVEVLAALFASHNIVFDRSKLRLIGDHDEFKPEGPFILVSPQRGGLTRAGLSFDKGAVRVVDEQGAVMFAASDLPKLSVAQLVKQGDIAGLWFVPAAAGRLPVARDVILDRDDIAFLDGNGVVLTVNSLQRKVSAIEYPEYESWFDLLGRYRVWLALLAWGVLAGLLLHFYRKSKRHTAGIQ